MRNRVVIREFQFIQFIRTDIENFFFIMQQKNFETEIFFCLLNFSPQKKSILCLSFYFRNLTVFSCLLPPISSLPKVIFHHLYPSPFLLNRLSFWIVSVSQSGLTCLFIHDFSFSFSFLFVFSTISSLTGFSVLLEFFYFLRNF